MKRTVISANSVKSRAEFHALPYDGVAQVEYSYLTVAGPMMFVPGSSSVAERRKNLG